MQKKNKKINMAKFETSTTHIPKFESSDIKKIDSYKDVLLEQSYDSNLTDFQKATYNRAIEIMEYRMLDVSANYLLANGELHKDSCNVPWKTQGNQESLGLKIEEWNDLEIRTGMDKVTFRKISSNSTKELFLKSLNWNNKSIKMDVIRLMARGTMRKSDFIVNYAETQRANPYETPENQSIKNAISDLRNDLYRLFPSLSGVDPVEYNRRDKYWSTPIKITLTDAEQKKIELKKKIEDSSVDFRRPDYDDNRLGTATFDEYEVFNMPDDVKKDDNGY